MTKDETKILFSTPISNLRGNIIVPGDKSLSHRALMIGSISTGTTRIKGMLESDDTLRTMEAMKALGVSIIHHKTSDEDFWIIHGRGVGGLLEPSEVIDVGNSGTGCRLLLGLVSGYNFKTIITGDESLKKRPMSRVMDPLYGMGCRFESRSDGLLPLLVKGTSNLTPITYTLPVASAQVKSAILLAGLHSRGNTRVIEPIETRDHTENLLSYFGAEIVCEPYEKVTGSSIISIKGLQELKGRNINVPGDPSSAVFLIVAALITEGSEIILENVGLNPKRTNVFKTLKKMGADLTVEESEKSHAEPIGTITARYSKLSAIEISEEDASSMIDEYPILSIAAASANGKTIMKGLSELRYKESNRLQAIFEGLNLCGVKSEIEGDNLIIFGSSGKVKGGGVIETHFDHRIAMAFLILGFNSISPIGVDNVDSIKTSYPGFFKDSRNLGAYFVDKELSEVDSFISKKY